MTRGIWVAKQLRSVSTRRAQGKIFLLTILGLSIAQVGCSSSKSSGGASTPTVTLTATPSSITAGQQTTLKFSSTNANTGTINNNVGPVGTSGSIHVQPSTTTMYTITVTGPGGSATASATVTVTPLPLPTVTMSANPTAIAAGQQSTLTFSSTNATQGTIDNGVGPSGTNGQVQVSPAATTTYTITVTGPGGSAKASATVTVMQAPTVTISATPTNMPTRGLSSTLIVAAANATQVVITDNVDNNAYTLSPTGGTQVVTPGRTTTYTATATGFNSSTNTASVTVTVPTVSLSMTTPVGIAGMSQHATNSADVDPNGAVGTKQYLEYVNVFYQAYDKVTGQPVFSADQDATNPWTAAGLTDCRSISLDMVILFDHLASRWVIAGHTTLVPGHYYYCIAISNTDDLSSSTLAWYAYEFELDSILGTNSLGNLYFPDWPKLGTWPDAYYVGMDLIDLDNNGAEVGVVACALDRTNMLTGGTPNPPQCFKVNSPLDNGVFLGHSLIPADIEGATAPPVGRDQFMVSIQNPPLDGSSTTSTSFNLWDFHVDWSNPANSTFTLSSVPEAPYWPGCYTAQIPAQTICVPEPAAMGIGQHIDSVGDRFMPRLAYRNFLSTTGFGYESFLISHTVQTGTGSPNPQQTGIRWYELHSYGSGTPFLFQNGTISPDNIVFRFLPSIAQDKLGDMAVGYSASYLQSNPGINASVLFLPDPGGVDETTILTGNAEEITSGNGNGKWGSYSSMTVDPVDDCTFWYVNEYFTNPATPNWTTQISNFKVPGCN